MPSKGPRRNVVTMGPDPFDVPPPGRVPRAVESALPYAAAVAAVVLAIAGTAALHGIMGTSVSILFFPAVLFTAVYFGYGPAIVATILSTVALSYFFIPPYYSFNIGADDGIRLAVFAVIAIVAASISAARKEADAAQRQAVIELRGALGTLQKVSGWPVFVDVSFAGAACQLLAHAASVVGCERVIAAWESDDEPWIYVASSAGEREGIVKLPPSVAASGSPKRLGRSWFVPGDAAGDRHGTAAGGAAPLSDWQDAQLAPEISARLPGQGIASAPFELEHLVGRLYCSGIAPGQAQEIMPLVNVVAHEVGTSLERLYLHDRLQQVAVREERIRLARDLHDGVLQSLTGIRLRLQILADAADATAAARDGLLAIERAIAIEQRELRLFIDDLKPTSRRAGASDSVLHLLRQLSDRLAPEWKTPILVRVTPDDLKAPSEAESTIRLLVQEAVINALKHAQPSRVSVEADQPAPGTLRLVVTNDGRGFPFSGRLSHHDLLAAGVGPVSLRERIVSIGGSMAVESAAIGSRIELIVPI